VLSGGRVGRMPTTTVSARDQRGTILASLLPPFSLSPDWHSGL
jgi:hypothetical protein